MERISRRKIWLLFALIIGIGTVYIGKKWLYVESACPRLQDLLLYVGVIIGTIVCLFFIITTRND